MKRKTIFSAIAVMLSACFIFTAFSCGGGGAEVSDKLAVTAVSPEEGKIVSVANDVVSEAAKNYEIGSLAKLQDGTDKYAGRSLKLRFAVKGNPAPYTVKLSLKEDMTEAKEFVASKGELELSDLFTGEQYFWTISATVNGAERTSSVYSFSTASAPRTVFIDGVSNTRDIGGYTAENGKRIRQGLIYRGANADGVSEAGISAAKEVYGIKTELDLREKPLAGGSPFGEEVKYLQYSGLYYTGGEMSFTEERNAFRIAEEFSAFTKEENYPVFFHCAVGRDRTGCLSMLLLAVCGVSEKDILLDYELTALSEAGYSDKNAITTCMPLFVQTLDYLKNYSDKGLTGNAEKFLLDRGVSEEEIAFVKNKLLY